MTDDARIDLHSLDAGDDPARTDAIVGSVMTTIERRPRGADIRELRRYRVTLAAAAAVFAAIAIVAMRGRPGDSRADDLVAEWARDGHVPTNGELLAAYLGYRP